MTNLSKVCETIYEREGQSAVFEFVLKNFPEIEWMTCDPCEISSPTQDGACLVCGSSVIKLLPNKLDLGASHEAK